MGRPKAVLVGTGFIGPVHVEALRRLGVDITGVFGSSPDRARKSSESLGISRVYQAYDELLNDSSVNVVHITSPNRHHFDQARRAIQAGKHVVCEKPLALNMRETAELAALARKSSVVAAVCYNIRYYPLCLEAKQRRLHGALGDVFHVTGSYVQDWLLYDTDFNWRVLAEEGGPLRAVADIGTHWLDLVQFITGLKVVKVCADLKTVMPTRQRPKGSVETFQSKLQTERKTEAVSIDTDDYGSILLEFDNGARGSVTVSQVTAGRKNCVRFEIAGSKSALAWNSETPNDLWIGHRDRANETLVRDPALLNPEVRRFANYPGGHNEGFPDTFKQLFRAVYDYIEVGDFKAAPTFPTFADGHHEVALCEAILQSHRRRAWVDVTGDT